MLPRGVKTKTPLPSRSSVMPSTNSLAVRHSTNSFCHSMMELSQCSLRCMTSRSRRASRGAYAPLSDASRELYTAGFCRLRQGSFLLMFILGSSAGASVEAFS